MRQTLVVDASRVTILMKGTEKFFFAVLFKKPTSKAEPKLKKFFCGVDYTRGTFIFDHHRLFPFDKMRYKIERACKKLRFKTKPSLQVSFVPFFYF